MILVSSITLTLYPIYIFPFIQFNTKLKHLLLKFVYFQTLEHNYRYSELIIKYSLILCYNFNNKVFFKIKPNCAFHKQNSLIVRDRPTLELCSASIYLIEFSLYFSFTLLQFHHEIYFYLLAQAWILVLFHVSGNTNISVHCIGSSSEKARFVDFVMES